MTLLAALLATLAFVPAAYAATQGPPDRSDGLGGAFVASHIAIVSPPDRVDALGSGVTTHTTVSAPPDRVDGIGSSRFTPVTAPTVIYRSIPASFDWTAAMLGAASGLGLALVVTAALRARGRRDVALLS